MTEVYCEGVRDGGKGMGGALDAKATDCALAITDWEQYCCVEKVDEWSGTVKCKLTGDARQENIDEDLIAVWDDPAPGSPFTIEGTRESSDETVLYLDLGLESGTTADEYTAEVTFKGYYKSVKPENIVCEDSIEVEVTILSVDIDKPNEDEVFLKGEELKFESRVEPSGLSGVTYAWSVTEGTCDPSTGTSADFETTLKSEGTIKVNLEVTVGGTTCDKERTIEAMLPEVVKLSWNDDYDLYSGDSGTTSIDDPVWVKTLGGAVAKNEAGAYIRTTDTDSKAKAELEIKADTALTYNTTVKVKGKKVADNDENFDSTGAYFHNWTWTAGELQLNSSPLYASVNFYDTLDVTWYYCVQKLAGGYGDWIEMNETSHDLYIVLADPEDPEDIPHVDILKLACKYAANQTGKGGVCDKMLSEGFANHWEWNEAAGGDCHLLSSDFIRLIGSVGFSGSQHRWSSKGSQTSGSIGWMCYQRTKSFTPVGQSAGVREWSWHQWAEAAGKQRDPSAAVSLSGNWGAYEDDLFTHYYECTNSSPFGATWVTNQSGQSSGCEVYPTNCTYNSSPSVYSWKGPN